MATEQQVFQLILHSGNGRSLSMEAIGCAKKKEFAKASVKLKLATEALSCAHQVQTELIQEEINCEDKTENHTLLMIHAQDHLMTALAVRELAGELVEVYECIKAK